MTQYDDIQELLGRFMNGQTSEAEEVRLVRYFRTATDMPGEWQAYRELFASFDTDLYAFSEQELDAMATPLAPVEQVMPVASRRSSLARRWLRVAASVAIVAGMGLAGYKRWVAPTPVAAPASQTKFTAQVARVPKAAPVSAREQQLAPLRKAPAARKPSPETVAKKASTAPRQDAALPASPQHEVAESPVAVATSCGFYAEADYAELLSQFGSLRELTQADYEADAPLVASNSQKPSPREPETAHTPVPASTGSPFDGEVVFSKIAVPFPPMP